MQTHYTYRASSKVDTGRMRPTNQDEVIMLNDMGFFAVLDGMGGLSGGGITSNMVKHVLPRMLVEAVSLSNWPIAPPEAAQLLAEQVAFLSFSIYESSNRERFTSGSTLSGVWLVCDSAVFVNLGDSRGYLLSHDGNRVKQITEDHNQAAEFAKLGIISRDEAIGHPLSYSLTAFVGAKPPLMPDTFILPVQPGDKILLCSDGLYGMVSEKRISGILNSSNTPDMICSQLIHEANKNGGDDNISVIFIAIL